MSKLTGILVVSAGLMLPLAAQDEHRNQREQQRNDHRYYDADHKDYHEWNDAEERAWRRYWEQQRHPVTDWQRANDAQRREYWRWRHEHPDSEHQERH